MSHVVLLGDSIFDNGAYVPGEPDVAAQLRERMGPDCEVSLLARDGDVTAGVERQLAGLPLDATHLIVSVGGNDALGASGLLGEPARTIGEAAARLGAAAARFGQYYAEMLDRLLAPGLPAAVCTIYDANYPEPYAQAVKAGLSLFNDAITRGAFARGIALIDLRLVCSEPADYANPIEPSARGGEKIAAAIAAFVRGEPGRPRSVVWC